MFALRLASRLLRPGSGSLVQKAHNASLGLSYQQTVTFADEDLYNIESYFKKSDRNSDYRLERAEFNTFNKHYIGRRLDTVDSEELFLRLDSDRDGELTIVDILQHLLQRFKIPERQEMEYAFCTYDKDEDGLIKLHECREALYFLGQWAGHPSVKTFFQEMDVNRDSKINFEEFVFILKRRMPALNFI